MQQVDYAAEADRQSAFDDMMRAGMKPEKIGKFGIRTFHEAESYGELREKLRQAYDIAMKDELAVSVKQLRIGRNDPCPCSSGAKFKRFCAWKCR